MDEFAYTFWGRLTEFVNDLFDYISERPASIILLIISFILFIYMNLKLKMGSFELKPTPKTKDKIFMTASTILGIGIIFLMFF
jgi:hypothetical protein